MRSFDEMGSRSSRLEKEAKERREAARKKVEAERAARARYEAEQAVQRGELEAKRRLEAVEREKDAARQREAARLTGGVAWAQTYRSVARARDGDRVSLPATALEELTAAGALEHGTALTFELELVDASGAVVGVPEAEFVDAPARGGDAAAMDVDDGDDDDDEKAGEQACASGLWVLYSDLAKRSCGFCPSKA